MDGGQVAASMRLTNGSGQLSGAGGTLFTPEGGLSLRDYFAAQAMYALAVQKDCWRYHSADEVTATRCYEMADAMLKARQS